MKYIDLELREKTKRNFQNTALIYPAFVELVNNFLLYEKEPTNEEIASVLPPLAQKSRKNAIEELKELLHDLYIKFNRLLSFKQKITIEKIKREVITFSALLAQSVSLSPNDAVKYC